MCSNSIPELKKWYTNAVDSTSTYSVDPDETAHTSRLIRIYNICTCIRIKHDSLYITSPCPEDGVKNADPEGRVSTF